MTAGVASRAALGQGLPDPATIHYYVFDLGELPNCSLRASYTATSINELGVIVGYMSDIDLECPAHAWVWSLCGSYGLPPRQMLDLTAMTGYSFSDFSEAWDVNEAGDVPGWQIVGDINRPIVWRLGSYNPMLNTTNSVLLGSTGTAGQARGVNDNAAGQPTVVGWSQAGAFAVDTPFAHVLGVDPLTSLPTLPTPLEGNPPAPKNGHAFRVSTPSPSDPPTDNAPRVAGGTGYPPAIGGCGSELVVDGIRWANGSPPTFQLLREDFLSATNPLQLLNWRAQANAVNQNRQAVGLYQDPTLACKRRAVLWRPNGVAVDLAADPAFPPLSETEALGLTKADASGLGLIVVGWEPSAIRGVIWWRESTPASPGSAPYLARRADSLCYRGSSGTWQLFRFADVNDQGWIVGNGGRIVSTPTGSELVLHAFLLVPVPSTIGCLADLNGDGVVAGADMSLLLGGWSPPGQPCTGCCVGDIDGNGVVNAADLTLLLGAWGLTCDAGAFAAENCGGFSEESSAIAMSSGDGDESEAAASLPPEVAAVIGMFGQDSIEGFGAWLAGLSASEADAVVTTLQIVIGGGQP